MFATLAVPPPTNTLTDWEEAGNYYSCPLPSSCLQTQLQSALSPQFTLLDARSPPPPSGWQAGLSLGGVGSEAKGK